MNPRQLGYRFPAEWEKHEATWLTWPYLDESFPGKLESIYPSYLQFIKLISEGEKVRLIIPDEKNLKITKYLLKKYEIRENSVEFFKIRSNDVWCRDHGPSFLINPNSKSRKIIVNWEFNAWGKKFEYKFDNLITGKIAKYLGLEIYKPGIVMEGGSVDLNGAGTLITTTSCILNKNRNPQLSKGNIEQYLQDFYGVDQILWLRDGIAGDDTDGHIDDIARFINKDTIVAMVELNKNDLNFKPLQENIKKLKEMHLSDGRQINIIELPMPDPVFDKEQRLPASYANFYFANSAVIVPTFRCKNDEAAIQILSEAINDRPVIGIDSSDLIWGYGSFHCLSQQEPEI